MILNAISSATGTGTAATDRAGIADNFDTFLQILTTQLKNQNPLEPLDTNEFTAQLVQFSQVEQQIKQNDNLEAIAKLAAASAATNAVSFIGKRVTAATTQATMANGTATWHYDAAETAQAAAFTIRDSAGSVVWTGDREVAQGSSTFVWDGRDTNGNKLPDGDYTLSVEARAADLSAIQVDISTETTIDGVDFSGDEPLLMAGGTVISLSDVRHIYAQ
ncbi:MAG: flagellar hook assembly protein FlgD [Rhodobiaceae bacterium]|nr:flagellar hook assembly protein FlgD [Rhodobiaceae bacterium]MCC0053390.1 flagellar hook assembly protein FlgD [Rhodobiaceae bacterium]